MWDQAFIVYGKDTMRYGVKLLWAAARTFRYFFGLYRDVVVEEGDEIAGAEALRCKSLFSRTSALPGILAGLWVMF